jgi:hypothetical protein
VRNRNGKDPRSDGEFPRGPHNNVAEDLRRRTLERRDIQYTLPSNPPLLFFLFRIVVSPLPHLRSRAAGVLAGDVGITANGREVTFEDVGEQGITSLRSKDWSPTDSSPGISVIPPLGMSLPQELLDQILSYPPSGGERDE